MNRMIFIASALLLAIPVAIEAGEKSNYRSARMLGKGNSGRSHASGEDALFLNPIGISHTRPEKIARQLEKSKESEVTENNSKKKNSKKSDANKQTKNIENPHFWTLRKATYFSTFIDASANASELATIQSGSTADQINAFKDLVGEPTHFTAQITFASIWRDFALGLNSLASADILVYKDPHDSGIETIDLDITQSQELTGAYTLPTGIDGFGLGAALKLLNVQKMGAALSISDVEKIKDLDLEKDKSTGQGLGLQLAASFQVEHSLSPRVALVVDHVGDTSLNAKKSSDNARDLYPIGQKINLATGLSTQHGSFDYLGHFDINDLLSRVEGNIYKKIHFGAEVIFNKLIALSGGFNQGYPTMGGSITGNYGRLDVGAYSQEVSDRVGKRPDSRYYLRFAGTF